jgi:hypothetical protein
MCSKALWAATYYWETKVFAIDPHTPRTMKTNDTMKDVVISALHTDQTQWLPRIVAAVKINLEGKQN